MDNIAHRVVAGFSDPSYGKWDEKQSEWSPSHKKWGALMVKTRQINPMTGAFGRYLDDGTWVSHHRLSCIPPCLCERCIEERIDLVGYFYAVLPPHHGTGHGPLLGTDGSVANWVVDKMVELGMPVRVSTPDWAPHSYLGPYLSSFLPYDIPTPGFPPATNALTLPNINGTRSNANGEFSSVISIFFTADQSSSWIWLQHASFGASSTKTWCHSN